MPVLDSCNYHVPLHLQLFLNPCHNVLHTSRLIFSLYLKYLLHEEIAELEKQRQGQPMPITLLNESKSKEKMESHNGESSDKADFIPYIFPDITTIVK